MKTISDFKKAGLKFVEGDVIRPFEGGKSETVSLNVAHHINHAHAPSGMWDDWHVTSFAPRANNTGNKPVFTGEIICETNSGQVYPPLKANMFIWTQTERSDCAKCWWPVLNSKAGESQIKTETPEEKLALDAVQMKARGTEVILTTVTGNSNLGIEHKETSRFHLSNNQPQVSNEVDENKKNAKSVFTQAMADAGELPPVGSECLLHLAFVTYTAEITYIGDGVGCFKNIMNGNEFTFSIQDASFKPIDTRTDRKKAIDRAMSAIVIPCNRESMEMTVGALYDAGLLKLDASDKK